MLRVCPASTKALFLPLLWSSLLLLMLFFTIYKLINYRPATDKDEEDDTHTWHWLREDAFQRESSVAYTTHRTNWRTGKVSKRNTTQGDRNDRKRDGDAAPI